MDVVSAGLTLRRKVPFDFGRLIEESMTDEKRKLRNIFDAVSQAESERRDVSPVEDVAAAGEDIQARAAKMHEEIELGLDHAFRFNDVSPSQFRKYISDPRNFSAQEWRLIEEQREKNNEQVSELERRVRALPPPSIRSEEASSKAAAEPSPSAAAEPKPKKKPVRVSRRNWLDMH